jgi:signal transduction histidine kinase
MAGPSFSALRSSHRGTPALLVFFPFLLLAAIFALTDVAAMHHVSSLRAETESVVRDMLAGLDLAGRMWRNVDRIELLAAQHVYERDAAGMAAVEQSIDASWADFDAAAAEYASKGLLASERASWRAVKTDIADIRPGVESVLEASRRNDDPVARARLLALHPAFARADSALRSIRDADRVAADDAVNRADSLERSVTLAMQVLAVAGVTFALAAGFVLTCAMKRRVDRTVRKAEVLEVTNRELDAFAGRVAHDLRNPLSTATMAAGTLAKQSPTSEQQKILTLMERSFGRMDTLIADLLALSKAEAKATNSVCDPVVAAEKLREELAPRVEEGALDLKVDVQSANVRCTDGLLWQVLWNLTENAIKYRRSDVFPVIEVCGAPTDGHYELAVKDNGVGIAPDEAAHVFEPFYRVTREKAKPGSGLGLSIVKRAVEANGGTVSVTSEVGSGSRFVARLPLA